MKFRAKLVLSHVIVSVVSIIVSIILINYLVRFFFIRIMIGRGISIVIPEAGTKFLSTVRSAILVSGAISTIISVIIALLISRYIIKPVAKMKDFARQISEGDFKARVEKEAEDEIGELADSLNYMAFHLEEIESMRTKLMQNISHDLRTPLASIKGYLEMLQDENFSKEEKEQGLEVIEKELDRLEKMAKDITKLSSADSKALPLEFEKIDIVKVLKEVFDVFSVKFKEKGLNSFFESTDESLFMLGDAQKIKEIFSNLFDNALKFTNQGFIKVNIEGKKEKIIITVEDSGTGIDKKDLPNVFKRFYKGSNTTDNSGMGIGLSIVKEYVYANKGEIKVESELGKGTKFIVEFPRLPS